MLDRVKKIIAIEDKYILNVYQFGSQVYGTNNENSDFDILIVIDNKINDKNNLEIRNGLYNIHLITEDNFKENLKKQKIKEMECIFLPNKFILQEKVKFVFKLNKELLREEISSKSNNSFVKAKKKMILDDEETYIGVKSLYHSLRIVDFGIQIANNSKITNYEYKKQWNDILIMYHNGSKWNDFKETYQPIFNKLMTDFRLVAPKQIEKNEKEFK